MQAATVLRSSRATRPLTSGRHVYALTLEYDGAGFSGWQRQPGRRTVEGTLQQAIAALCGESAPLTAAGRTDAGAHAHGQVVGCTLRRSWDCERLRAALNARLPEDVAVVDVRPAPPGFHARFDAIARTYRYVVAPRRPQPVGRQYAWLVRGPLDEVAMRAAARVLIGTHDFAAFGRSPRAGGTTVRTIHAVDIRRMSVPDAVTDAAAGESPDVSAQPRSVVVIDVTADAFLYGMMRAFAGALVAVGTGRLDADRVADMLSTPVSAGRASIAAAPAHGLHQWRVTYAADSAAPTPAREGR
jgi:tRNA pseudouridine38-40 synthase